MLYAFLLIDRAGAAELRARHRPAHKAYLAGVADRICVAGPLLADDGQTMNGSLLVIDFDSREAADAWLRDEPFTRAGVYERQELHPMLSLWPQRAGIVAA